ncbi:MAG: efflux RND transporter periplasmic adaptor subunit [Alphaproteobacteria bacterium]|nr:efflux RND transporter periplasmic adaptor subunit [Alphaproteobacteria bacterium]
MKKVFFLFVIAFMAACEPQENGYYGYVEGEYIFMAPTTPGLLEKLYVYRGQAVRRGDTLFALEMTGLDAERVSAEAALAQTRVAETSAQKEWDRLRALRIKKAVSQAAEDAQEATYAAAKAARQEAEQALIQIDRKRADAAPKAPATGRIENTYFREGEYVAAGMPVVSLLPPENVKVRFFVPQKAVPTFSLGKKILIRCDGCDHPLEATISFIASKAEYTPPVIYSIESRNKLVFMLEARPDAYAAVLRPGLPVDIEVP